MEEVTNEVFAPKVRGVLICPDIAPFVSSVDRSEITGRAALREHNRRNNVTNAEDYKETWQKARRERERMFGGDPTFDKTRRLEKLVHAVDKHTRRR